MSKNSVRELALLILNKVELEGSYSNLLLKEIINNENLKNEDNRLLTEIVYGTIQNKVLLDYYLEPFLEGKKVKPWVRNLLRISLYQKIFLDKIPSHAYINESVKIAKAKDGQFTANFVNAILREVERKGLREVSGKNNLETLGIKTSHPIWLLKMWEKQYGFEIMEKCAYANNTRPYLSARVNRHLTNKNEMIDALSATNGLLAEDCLYLNSGNIADTNQFKEGLISIQDESSMMVAQIMAPQPNEYILDMCAAPGGKTTHIASLMNNTGQIDAYDIHEHKMRLIEENAKRQQLTNINVGCIDATELGEKYDEETFDRILVDAPCSGFGVIRRKPDIKYQKVQNELDGIINIQNQLLDVAAPLLKKEGILLYSTCTINRKENDKQVEAFLKRHPEFILIEELQIFPYEYNSDGFYIAKMKKSK